MNYYEFAQLVQEMRAAQKRYFKRRTRSDLTEAKRLERQVDHAIAEFIGPLPQQSAIWEATDALP